MLSIDDNSPRLDGSSPEIPIRRSRFLRFFIPLIDEGIGPMGVSSANFTPKVSFVQFTNQRYSRLTRLPKDEGIPLVIFHMMRSSFRLTRFPRDSGISVEEYTFCGRSPISLVYSLSSVRKRRFVRLPISDGIPPGMLHAYICSSSSCGKSPISAGIGAVIPRLLSLITSLRRWERPLMDFGIYPV